MAKKLIEATVNVRELAEAFSVSTQAVQGWFVRPDAPKPVSDTRAGRRWLLVDVLRWRLRRMDPADADAALGEARLQLAETRAELETIKLAKARGETVSKEKHHAGPPRSRPARSP